MKNFIDVTIYPNDDVIYAVHTGPHAEQVKKLFGTVIIPTPYTRQYGIARAVAAIQALNPDVVVYPKL